MRNYFRTHLGAKLFLTYVIIILVVMLIVIGVTQFSLPGAYSRHMAGMGMGGDGYGQGMMGGQGNGQSYFQNFKAGFNEALLWAAPISVLLALLVSVLFSRRLVAPLRAMMIASQRIADGHYNERVLRPGSDELGQLADRFNLMAEKLEQIESRRRQLIGDVAHELRTPLTTIKGSMEGLIDGILPAEIETYEQVRQEANRLEGLVDDLQELSRVEAGAYKLELRPISLMEVVEKVKKRLGLQYEEKDVSLIIEFPPELPPVMADEDRIDQVLTNLMGNALHYTHSGGRVHVSAQNVDDRVQVTVKDNGIGISAEHLPYIFDRFFRVDKSRSRHRGGGSGVGLTIARALVEAHGGSIQAQSEGEGKGSTFSFSLPEVKK